MITYLADNLSICIDHELRRIYFCVCCDQEYYIELEPIERVNSVYTLRAAIGIMCTIINLYPRDSYIFKEDARCIIRIKHTLGELIPMSLGDRTSFLEEYILSVKGAIPPMNYKLTKKMHS